MKLRKPVVVANWKMNGLLATIRPLLINICDHLDTGGNAETVICAPYVYLAELATSLVHTDIILGAQNVSHLQSGALTGEISAEMLRDMSCHYVIVGHSERRTLYSEHDSLVATKFERAQQAGLQPILCLGEQLQARQCGDTEAVIKQQLQTVLTLVGIVAFKRAVIAYEPVWAIGTGETATPEQVQEVHAFIRLLLTQYDATVADGVRIIYGGSVKPINSTKIFAMTDVDGGLIGGASLHATEFVNICHTLQG